MKKLSKTSTFKYERGADRFDTELPVELGGIRGFSRNISASGIYFETETTREPGSNVNFTVEVVVRGQKLKLQCEGEVVRMGCYDGLLGIAAKFVSPFFPDGIEVIDAHFSVMETQIHSSNSLISEGHKALCMHIP
ncbi:PilZ domain-containing protein [Rhodoferax sp. UBA5149]|uniref:PilZ domain-containing protein n=1 Tax=Rhodoferax sp. UBA5149 TaxID=1947379 RepID=UPI0026006829|nr:PilZ domain-containing protein [Rhodoferax sp. UBA5149]